MKRRRAVCLTLTSLCTLSAAVAAVAQPRVHEAVIVTAAAAPVPFNNLARAVTVLTREQIARLPARSLAELLRFAVGLDVRTRGAFGMQSDFSIRGAAFGQTLVLVDGVRINDAQSGHHNADLPIPLDEIDRIEILYGAGSSVHGADAFGGTINVITRSQAAGTRASLSGGEFGLVQGELRWSGGRPEAPTVAVEAARSSGFMFARDFHTLAASAGLGIGGRTRLRISHVRKEFGANGFYGPSPSREWTDQTLATIDRRLLEDARWRASAVASYRTHGDRFLWNVRQPGLFENRHRTHAALAGVKVRRTLRKGTDLTVGGEAGGDWIESTNLGNHRFARVGGYAEAQHALGPHAVIYPGLRYDTYSSFGSAWSPSLSASVWLAAPLRIRGAAGRAFRIPTFTELYYRDPAHDAGGELRPETGWSGEAGADWLIDAAWLASGTVFARRDHDVIDWIRESPAVKWRSTNIHSVETSGLELEVRRFVGSSGEVGVHYARLSADAGLVPFISKYVLDYARHSWAFKASSDLPGGIGLGQRVALTRRADGRNYWVADARLSRAFRRARFFVEADNLLDTRYQEIIGVEMPGRSVRAGVQVGR